jgi:hypothetical protein
MGASLFACGAPIMPALVTAGDVEDAGEQTCASDDLFADVPVEALVLGNHLWVRGAGGTLASLPVSGDNTITYHLEHERVVDVQSTSTGALWALSVADGPGDMRIWQRTTGGWTPLWEMGAPSDAMALVELGGWPAVVTPERVYVATGELWTRQLDPPLPKVTQYQVVAHGSSIWVTARGAGWLYAIDAKTGDTTGVADVQPQPCSGLLDPACDVITDLDADVRKPGCVLVTTRGRVLRACPDGSIDQAPGVRRAVRAEWAEQIRALALLYPEHSASRLHLLSLIRAENPTELARHGLDDFPAPESDPIEAVAPTDGGYLALGQADLYRVDARNTRRAKLSQGESRCGLEVTRSGGALIVNASQPLPLLASIASAPPPPTEALTAPPPPCADTVIYYARGEGEGGVTVVLQCEADEVTMVQRSFPKDRFFSVPFTSWRALWADLERAQWRSWKSCDPSEAAHGTNDRFMISTPEHTLQVDCPHAVLDSRQRAVLERLANIFDRTRRSETSDRSLRAD